MGERSMPDDYRPSARRISTCQAVSPLQRTMAAGAHATCTAGWNKQPSPSVYFERGFARQDREPVPDTRRLRWPAAGMTARVHQPESCHGPSPLLSFPRPARLRRAPAGIRARLARAGAHVMPCGLRRRAGRLVVDVRVGRRQRHHPAAFVGHRIDRARQRRSQSVRHRVRATRRADLEHAETG
ncbi:hypothetical protein EMIT0111MI5_20127 [Burkholderia sp. IT-111MI5]